MNRPRAELMGDQQEARAEALDLQGPVGLPVNAVPDAAGREPDEREEAESEDTREDASADERLAPAVAPPDIRERGRNDDDGEDLRRRREADDSEAGPFPIREHGGESEHKQRRRPEIEARQDH